MTQVAVGIDHSLSGTGVAIIRAGARPLLRTFGPTFKTPPDASMQQELRRIQNVAGRAVLWIGSNLQPDDEALHVFEEPPAHLPAGKSGKRDERSGLRWIMAVNLVRGRAACAQVAPATVKKFWTGNGAADKALMKRFAQLRYPGLDLIDDNAVDGLALATMGAEHLGITLMAENPAPDRTLLAGVRWPATTRKEPA